ncbi:nuclear transport factor 2 family protein [Phenylobacterium deserti]|uniref:Nuclear transport factor 2 family protein n=1 Tax=Phenylobacterium deserti TaxID=1914756 RepID=A0A328AA39_9CAUL|nr:nuclear transport factor 2 family protein [Phenylobacterium deserti]RAK51267.1 hypothetical protein DJ018_15070 [Phenylobacterium deserti]
MRPLAATLAALALVAGPALAAPKPDPANAEVLAVVDRFFAGLKAGDWTSVEGLLIPEGTINVQRTLPDGGNHHRVLTFRAWLDSLAGKPGFEEQYWSPTVLRRGPIAVVWAPYEVHTPQDRHCGIDSFDLVQKDGTWKIANLMWTSEPDACEALGWKPKG